MFFALVILGCVQFTLQAITGLVALSVRFIPFPGMWDRNYRCALVFNFCADITGSAWLVEQYVAKFPLVVHFGRVSGNIISRFVSSLVLFCEEKYMYLHVNTWHDLRAISQSLLLFVQRPAFFPYLLNEKKYKVCKSCGARHKTHSWSPFFLQFCNSSCCFSTYDYLVEEAKERNLAKKAKRAEKLKQQQSREAIEGDQVTKGRQLVHRVRVSFLWCVFVRTLSAWRSCAMWTIPSQRFKWC